jgi:hypothetical protein
LFVDAIRNMSLPRSVELGQEARSWAIATHTGECFESGLLDLCTELGVRV